MLLALAVAAVLPGCASFDGIGSNHRVAAPSSLESARALPGEHGDWPAADWARRYGDAQLGALIAEALQHSPTLEQAAARVAAAAAVRDGAYAAAGPRVNLDAGSSRQRFTANAMVPPPVAGTWQTENKAVLSAAYELDVWGKHRAAESAAVSRLSYAKADGKRQRVDHDALFRAHQPAVQAHRVPLVGQQAALGRMPLRGPEHGLRAGQVEQSDVGKRHEQDERSLAGKEHGKKHDRNDRSILPAAARKSRTPGRCRNRPGPASRFMQHSPIICLDSL